MELRRIRVDVEKGVKEEKGVMRRLREKQGR